MSNNKYKHIKLPQEMILQGGNHSFQQNPFPQPKPNFDVVTHKRNLSVRSNQLVEQFNKLQSTRKLNQDKGISEVEVLFRGFADNGFIKKYGIEIYNKEDSRIVGKISNQKLPGQELSDFEKLNLDIKQYIESNKLPSYFEKIEDISPLNIEDVMDINLIEEFNENPNNEIMVDISFADESDLSKIKLNSIKDEYKEKFISHINSNLVHFGRVISNFSKLKEIVSEYGGISFIEESPDFDMLTSSVDVKIRNSQVVPLEGNNDPIFIFDKPINPEHISIKGAVVEQIGSIDGSKVHGTGVASLAVCGLTLHPDQPIVQKNSIISINIFEGNRTEEIIKQVIEDYASKYPLILANLSMNRYTKGYTRQRVDNFTVMLDELSNKYNCLFFISAGNIKELFRDPVIIADSIKMGYPNYFNKKYSFLVPPADSINNVSVGSITYQQSPNSIAKISNPAPFTRINFPDNCFIKPDFVHYDGNLKICGTNYLSEGNGVTCASDESSSLTTHDGTSLTSPLIANMAGILHNTYPEYNTNSIRGLLTQFANQVEAEQIKDDDMKKRLIGFGMPDLEKALYSLSSSTTIVVEDSIGMDKKKIIKIPIPDSIHGDSKKRLKIFMTLVYKPVVNPKDINKYSPVNILARLVRSDDYEMNSPTTRGKRTDAYSKSNVKKYSPVEVSTIKHVGSIWKVEILSEKRSDDIQDNYVQPYSLIITIEDMKEDTEVNLYQDIVQMIEIESHVEVPIEVAAS